MQLVIRLYDLGQAMLHSFRLSTGLPKNGNVTPPVCWNLIMWSCLACCLPMVCMKAVRSGWAILVTASGRPRANTRWSPSSKQKIHHSILNKLHCKKRLAIFPSPPGRVWLVTLGTGKSLTFLQCTLLLREIVSLLQKPVLQKFSKLYKSKWWQWALFLLGTVAT